MLLLPVISIIQFVSLETGPIGSLLLVLLTLYLLFAAIVESKIRVGKYDNFKQFLLRLSGIYVFGGNLSQQS